MTWQLFLTLWALLSILTGVGWIRFCVARDAYGNPHPQLDKQISDRDGAEASHERLDA